LAALFPKASSSLGLLLVWTEGAEWDFVQFLLSFTSIVVWRTELVAGDYLSFSVKEPLLMPQQ